MGRAFFKPFVDACCSYTKRSLGPNRTCLTFPEQEVALWCCQSGHVDVNAQDNAGFTPLHETCIGGHVAIAKTLLAYGADINVASRLDGIRYAEANCSPNQRRQYSFIVVYDTLGWMVVSHIQLFL